ncbi:hypothetical protein GRI72_02790 [Altererythrobacter marinus]|uniref:Uncharacterized protein n=1 Tax=Pelagerythrobacter marinus TaxID=538382 RepID=A0ABW9USB3_9SPHN|nr:hypothetical protein [Pelagerythrobacter marinus]MXO67759.1 hypothetical protein [Pelagerythrobacter marinus]
MANEIEQWAAERVCQIVNEDGSTYKPECFLEEGALLSYSIGKAFARYIMEHEEPPVDPLLLEAREICARAFEQDDSFSAKQFAQSVRNGDVDDVGAMKATRDALRRGFELGKAGEPTDGE